MICVENLISLISALTCGVTLPLNKASKANGIDGNGVSDGTAELTSVFVGAEFVGAFSDVFAGAGF